jgi:hypothetical protein
VAAAIGAAVLLAACSHSHKSPSANHTTEPPSTTVPGPTPGPTVTAIAGVKPPVTPTQLATLFGTTLPGPRAATNGKPTFLYGDVTSTTGEFPHLVVSITIYTPAILRQQGTTPADFFTQGEDPTAKHLSGVGKQAYLVQDYVTVLTNKNNVVTVAANQAIPESKLEAAAKQVASTL